MSLGPAAPGRSLLSVNIGFPKGATRPCHWRMRKIFICRGEFSPSGRDEAIGRGYVLGFAALLPTNFSLLHMPARVSHDIRLPKSVPRVDSVPGRSVRVSLESQGTRAHLRV